MTSVETVTVKGSPVRSLKKFIDTDLTSDQRAILFRNLPPEYVRRLESAILPTESIPVHILNTVTEEAAKVKGEPLESFGRRAGKAAASDAVKGIYRFFALVLTAPALLSKASSMWSSLYNQGALSVEDQTDSSARIVLSDFPSEPAFCARFAGWVERMAEMTGSKNINVVHAGCAARGGACCEWKVSWT
jgi:hypothetical protein